MHKFNNKSGHKSGTEKGLNIVNDEGERLAKGLAPNGNEVIMKYVNVHSGHSDNGGYMSRGSAGCVTIHPEDAASFFENFEWNKNSNKGTSTGAIFIYRKNNEEKQNQYKRVISQ